MASEVVTVEGARVQQSRAEARPYAPSWADVIMSWLERAPGPTWLAYLVLLAISLCLAGSEGLLATPPAFDPVQVFYGFFFVTPLAVLHYLHHIAGQAWDEFKDVTNLDDSAAARVRYELTTAPARPAWVLLALGYAVNTLWYTSDPVGIGISGQTPMYVVVRGIVEGLLAGTLFLLVMQVVRQLRIIDRIHGAATKVDLLQPQAVRAMSRLTARSAIVIVILAVAVGVPTPGITEQSLIVTWALFSAPMLALAAAAFFVPLRGLHDRLATEKSRMLSIGADRLHETINAVHRLAETESRNASDADQSRLAQTRIDALSKAQTALVQERELIARLSTWPWDPSTLRAVVSAIALPIVLFLITRVLDRFV